MLKIARTDIFYKLLRITNDTMYFTLCARIRGAGAKFSFTPKFTTFDLK
jgi:hypothetical protein